MMPYEYDEVPDIIDLTPHTISRPRRTTGQLPHHPCNMRRRALSAPLWTPDPKDPAACHMCHVTQCQYCGQCHNACCRRSAVVCAQAQDDIMRRRDGIPADEPVLNPRPKKRRFWQRLFKPKDQQEVD